MDCITLCIIIIHLKVFTRGKIRGNNMKMIQKDDLIIKMYLSNEIDEIIKSDFINVHNKVFGKNGISSDVFRIKYIDNIYGSSILVVVYSESKPIAARAFWRNDIGNLESYQPCDTAVLKEWRGKDIFKLMTEDALNLINSESLIYNYPNSKSYKQYLKLGWIPYKTCFLKFLISFKAYKNVNPEIIDNSYVKWWFEKDRDKYSVYFRKSDFYLLRKTRKFNMFIVIGRISEDAAFNFEKVKSRLPLLFYYGVKRNFHIRKTTPINIVIKQGKDIDLPRVPLWRMDAI